MRKTNSGIGRQFFLSKINKSVMLSKLTRSGEMLFFNAYYGSQMVGLKCLPFKITDVQFITIAEIKKEEKGKFNVIGHIRWISQMSKSNQGKAVRDAVIADATGHIVISFWEDMINNIKENQCYEVSNVSIKNYFGKKLNTSTTTKISEHDQQMDINWTSIEMTDFKKQENEIKERTTPTLCCPDVLSAKINIFPTCPTPNCLKRIEVPGDIKVVKCPSCANRSLTKKLNASFIGEINFEHKGEVYQLTVFPETLNKYLSKDVIKEYWGKTETLEIEILELFDIDVTYSVSKKVILKIVDHEDPVDPIN